MATTPIPTNECAFGADEIIRATQAKFSGPADLRLTGVSIDSRTINPGALFVALRGVRDGHEFVKMAAERGARAAIVEFGHATGTIPCFEVADTLAALGQLAGFHLQRIRASRHVPVIAIGGAAGKTTTKELTAAVARALFGEILATPGNLNNLIGVPMTILTLTVAHRAAVLECGTNRRGEIERLSAIVRPDVAMVLNVDVEHTEGLGSLEGVADEEAGLFANAQIAVTGSDETMLRARIPAGLRTVTFGSSADADVFLKHRAVGTHGRQQITISLPSDRVEPGLRHEIDANLRLIGASSALNAAAAVAAVTAARPKPLNHAELDAIAAALERVEPVAGRLSSRDIHGILVIDDSYNANPRSVVAALKAAQEIARGLNARFIIALGDMLELGDLSARMHAEIVSEVVRAAPAEFVAVGPELAAGVHTVFDDSHPDSRLKPVLAADSAQAAARVREIARTGDVLLVKGSRGIAMERVIETLAR